MPAPSISTTPRMPIVLDGETAESLSVLLDRMLARHPLSPLDRLDLTNAKRIIDAERRRATRAVLACDNERPSKMTVDLIDRLELTTARYVTGVGSLHEKNDARTALEALLAIVERRAREAVEERDAIRRQMVEREKEAATDMLQFANEMLEGRVKTLRPTGTEG